MRVRLLGLLPILTLAIWMSPARAFLDPPYITPANPGPGDAISVSIYGGQCDLVDVGLEWPPPVTQQGNEITIHFTGDHESDPELCYFGIGTTTYPVGTYSPGSYTLHVEWRYMSFGGIWVQETLGVIPLTVTGVPLRQPIAAPMLSAGGLAGLLLVLMSAAVRALRGR
jgi:hypothetical protein